MMTPKEIMNELWKPDGQPDRQLDQYEGFYMALGDPVMRYLNANRKRGTTSIDRWGVSIFFGENAPGPIPVHNKDVTVLQDITKWKEIVKAPEIEKYAADGWEEFSRKVHDECGDRLLTGFYGHGYFRGCIS